MVIICVILAIYFLWKGKTDYDAAMAAIWAASAVVWSLS